MSFTVIEGDVTLRDATGSEKGVSGNPVRTDPTGTTTQPVSAASLPLPAGAATETTLAALNTNAADIETILVAIRDTAGIKKITDALPAGTNNIGDVDVLSSALPTGAATEATLATLATETTVAAINTATGTTADADTTNTIIGRLKQLVTKLAGGLPAALVGGRLDANTGAWLGSTAPTVGQKAMTASLPVTFASDQSTLPVSSGATEEATFTVIATAVVLGNGKSLLSIYNPSASTKKLKLREYYVRNAQTTAVTGVAAQLEIRKIISGTAPSGGTDLTANIIAHDSTDSIGAGIVAYTGATLSGEGTVPLDIMRISSDEWGPGTLDQEGAQQTISNYLPARVKRDAQQKPIVVMNAGQGVTLKCVTNTTAGSFDLIFVFTQV